MSCLRVSLQAIPVTMEIILVGLLKSKNSLGLLDNWKQEAIFKVSPAMWLTIKTREKVSKLKEFHYQETKSFHKADLKDLLIILLTFNQVGFKDHSNINLRDNWKLVVILKVHQVMELTIVQKVRFKELKDILCLKIRLCLMASFRETLHITRIISKINSKEESSLSLKERWRLVEILRENQAT